MKMNIKEGETMKEIGLYIHIPFCEKKCYYCDFTSFSGEKHLIGPYVEALKQEVLLYKEALTGYEIKTIFFGGGTPSILSGEAMAELMEWIRRHVEIDTKAEISMEANPGLLSKDKLHRYYDSGINRLSIGLQACQDHLLKSLGRIHTYGDFIQNLADARGVGFSNINVDMMFALPNQSMNEWKASLTEIIDLGVPHLSTYGLIIEEGTSFNQWVEDKKIKTLDEELELAMFHETIRILKSKGYTHYEISNFSKPEYECRHNQIYWRNRPYLGLGVGAHSYFEKMRFSNTSHIGIYINKINIGEKPLDTQELITRNDEISETMFLGLRLLEGVSINDFTERFQSSVFDVYGDVINKLISQGLLTIKGDRIRLSQRGVDLSNIVFAEMLLE
ncbi:radical SAM family heme chaperone HemW [Alkaliphilus metalliredigens]|nr:radical SAM family heme chaperone HemW [Alkaliphilus metalliredigens]